MSQKNITPTVAFKPKNKEEYEVYKLFQKDPNKFLLELFPKYSHIKIPFKVDGSLDLSETTIKFLPDNLTIEGRFDLNDCKNLVELPNNLMVGGDLDLRFNNFTTLPDSLVVYGDLFLGRSKISVHPLAFKYLNLYIWSKIC